MSDIPKKTRDEVYQRDQGMCQCCNSESNTGIHHIVFRSTSLNHSLENLVTLCFKCHRLVHDGLLTARNINGSFFFGGPMKWQARGVK